MYWSILPTANQHTLHNPTTSNSRLLPPPPDIIQTLPLLKLETPPRLPKKPGQPFMRRKRLPLRLAEILLLEQGGIGEWWTGRGLVFVDLLGLPETHH